MDSQPVNAVVTIAVAITGVAILAVIVGRNSRTADVITAAGQAFAQDLAVAVSPVTGGGSNYSFA